MIFRGSTYCWNESEFAVYYLFAVLVYAICKHFVVPTVSSIVSRGNELVNSEPYVPSAE